MQPGAGAHRERSRPAARDLQAHRRVRRLPDGLGGLCAGGRGPHRPPRGAGRIRDRLPRLGPHLLGRRRARARAHGNGDPGTPHGDRAQHRRGSATRPVARGGARARLHGIHLPPLGRGRRALPGRTQPLRAGRRRLRRGGGAAAPGTGGRPRLRPALAARPRRAAAGRGPPGSHEQHRRHRRVGSGRLDQPHHLVARDLPDLRHPARPVHAHDGFVHGAAPSRRPAVGDGMDAPVPRRGEGRRPGVPRAASRRRHADHQRPRHPRTRRRGQPGADGGHRAGHHGAQARRADARRAERDSRRRAGGKAPAPFPGRDRDGDRGHGARHARLGPAPGRRRHPHAPRGGARPARGFRERGRRPGDRREGRLLRNGGMATRNRDRRGHRHRRAVGRLSRRRARLRPARELVAAHLRGRRPRAGHVRPVLPHARPADGLPPPPHRPGQPPRRHRHHAPPRGIRPARERGPLPLALRQQQRRRAAHLAGGAHTRRQSGGAADLRADAGGAARRRKK